MSAIRSNGASGEDRSSFYSIEKTADYCCLFSQNPADYSDTFFASFFPAAITQHDRFPEHHSLAGEPERPAADTATDLAVSLAEIRREALDRVTAELNGRLSLLSDPAPRFGDIRFSIGKAVRERAETAGVPPYLSESSLS